MTLVAYMSHPIGPGSDLKEIGARQDNLNNAHVWFRRLVIHTRWALMAPWLAYLTAVGNALHGPRALADQVMLLERCDLLVQVGGWMSPHMRIEANHAIRRGIPVINLLDLGANPHQDEFIGKEIAKRTAHIESLPQRRVWMPPLDAQDIEALRAAQVVLGADPFSADAKLVIERIVHAALKNK